MTIAANPSKRKPTEAANDEFIAAPTRRIEASVKAVPGQRTGPKTRRNVTLAFDADIYDRVGLAADRLGISRNGFFSQAAVEKMEAMGI